MLFIAFMAVLMLGVITGVGLGLVLGYWIGFYSRPANDSTVCNSCRCAFCEDKPGQIIDLCEDHAEVESLHTALRDAERERDEARAQVAAAAALVVIWKRRSKNWTDKVTGVEVYAVAADELTEALKGEVDG